MQVPERLTLIGGSILLASTLIFTLKSQASSILPKIAQPISNIQDKTSDAQNGNDFSDGIKQAQQKGWQNGNWGSAEYYIDDNQNMYVGGGSLQGALKDIPNAGNIRTLNFERSVQAPQNSDYLLTPTNGNDNYTLTDINGAEKIDTSNVQSMYRIFGADDALKGVNVSTWNTSQVKNMSGLFVSNTAIQNIEGINNWDVRSVSDLGWAFYNLPSLHKLDLSGWHINGSLSNSMLTSFSRSSNFSELNIQNFDNTNTSTNHIFGDNPNDYFTPDSIQKITLGDKSVLRQSGTTDGNWKNGNQILSNSQLNDGNSHPGTWVKQ